MVARSPKDDSPARRPRRARSSTPPPGSLFSDDDLHLFHEGSHFHLQNHLGSHPLTRGGAAGCHFAVFAPNAKTVTVTGDFNGWNNESHPLSRRGGGGVWEGFVPGVGEGGVYKYHLVSEYNGYSVDKADPFAFRQERPPRTASVVAALPFVWADTEWMAGRAALQKPTSPLSIYEVHLGSWMRGPEGRFLTYREIAAPLADYAREMGYTHVEFLPVMEHPYYASWGYQVTGFFAPSSRQGAPEDFQSLIDQLHQAGIGVILDWVPSHFPTDEHGLGYFDGTHLYEHADPRQGFHPDWKSAIFNYGRPEVKAFLISSALFWIEGYHADGLRVDGVASMLHLDYSRNPGEWVANEYGGRENLDAISFLRRMNEHVLRAHPDVLTIAEESTSWPMVTRPTSVGGLGFRMKWDMGWMNDTLEYLLLDPVHRAFNHGLLTFRPMYAYSENFLLPLSHDEVVHMKGSLLNKMPGDDWKKFANLRLLLAYQAAVPGKKLLFMGGDIGQWAEWDHDASVQWHLLGQPAHAGIRRWAARMNHLHASELALHELDFEPAGFEWVDFRDSPQSVLAFLRLASNEDAILAAFNFTPVPRHGYRLGVPRGGPWTEIGNGDGADYGGSGLSNGEGVEAEPVPSHGRPFSVLVTLPPLAAIFLKSAKRAPALAELEAEIESSAPSPRARGERRGEGQLAADPPSESTESAPAEIAVPEKV
ncbi:MAG: 1,4-alpha-glucan branching protein GlgB [Acidobacteria bacterium]|nr:1,4-alpha-glucan branching protein GlgB [Acidobacteriota bacterium]MCA1612085.1 1,4-alpha-glucan branching protein GlgB [Acidobacteriota bacterium]